MKRILTGIRPTGNLHFGHLYGAVNNWVRLQDEYDFYLEIADVQALTDHFNDPDMVRKNVYELTSDLLAAGIDPNRVNIFIQSEIPEIAELTVYFSNLVTMSRLYRNPTVKSEIAQKKELFGTEGESVTYGFVGYPVSQAADILSIKGDVIPVGEDQLPLIEQTREIVRKFNNIYGDTFKEPESLLSKTPRIKGLDGNEKMGKSLGNAIYLNDDEQTINNKIMGAITDPDKIHKDDKANPDKCMVYYYHKLINSNNLDTICSECKNGTRGCVTCKKELIYNMNEYLKSFREKKAYLNAHPEEVERILKEGTQKAKQTAEETMKEVKKAIKIDYFK